MIKSSPTIYFTLATLVNVTFILSNTASRVLHVHAEYSTQYGE